MDENSSLCRVVEQSLCRFAAISKEMGHGSVAYPIFDDAGHYEFTEEELKQIAFHKSKYPSTRSAVMPALWIAQEKYGWLSMGVIKLVADTLELPFAQVYGVASFYTMYLKQEVGSFLLEICTCFTCGECGGDTLYEYAKRVLQLDENGRSADKMFTIREAECLGACDTAPVCQVHNRRITHSMTPESFDTLVAELRQGKYPDYKAVPLPDQKNLF